MYLNWGKDPHTFPQTGGDNDFDVDDYDPMGHLVSKGPKVHTDSPSRRI